MASEFSLERVLTYRRQKEEELTVQLASLEDEYRRSVEKLRQLQLEQLDLQEKRKSLLKQGLTSPNTLISHDAYQHAVEDKIRHQAMQVSSMAKEIENKRAQLLEAVKERKKIERLKEQWLRERLREQVRTETKLNDEAGINLYNRRRASE